MLDRLTSFLTRLPGGQGGRRKQSAEDPHVAAAALMFHVVNADGILEDREKARLRLVLSEAYSLTGIELDAVVAAGAEADREAIDLYAFTRVLKRHLDAEARIEFVALLWEMAYADGRADELEDNTVWRIAELIGVDRRDRILERQKAQAEAPGSTGTATED